MAAAAADRRNMSEFWPGEQLTGAEWAQRPPVAEMEEPSWVEVEEGVAEVGLLEDLASLAASDHLTSTQQRIMGTAY